MRRRGVPAVNPSDIKRYNRTKHLLTLGEFVLTIVLLYGALATGAAQWASRFTAQYAGHWMAHTLLYAAFGLLISDIIFAPLSYYGGYRLEHRFKLSNQTRAAWAKDWLKGCAVGFIISLICTTALCYLIRQFPSLWWVFAAAGWLLFSIVLTKLAPVFLIPIFYKLRPLTEGEDVDALKALAHKAGINLLGIYEIGFREKTNKANAALTGLGSTKRVILSDTMRKDFAPGEIAAVIAHELGHYVRGHLLKRIAWSTMITFIILAFCDAALRRLMPVFQIPGMGDPSALALLALCLSGSGALSLPVSNYISRRHEREADAFAVLHAGKEPFIGAMHKLSSMNLADPQPHPLIEAILYSHPSISRRIKAAR